MEWWRAFTLSLLLLANPAAAATDSVSAADAIKHVGEQARVCGVVASAKFASSSKRQPTFLNLDRPYPNHIFTAVVFGSDRAAFPYAPESLQGQKICVSGKIEMYKGKPEIIVSKPSQIEVSGKQGSDSAAPH